MASSMVASFSSSRCAASYWKHPATVARGEYSTRGASPVVAGAVPCDRGSTELLCAPPTPQGLPRRRRAPCPTPARAPRAPGLHQSARRPPGARELAAGRPGRQRPPPLRAHLRLVLRRPRGARSPDASARALRTFSVLEPGGPGGCASRRRATAEETARPSGCTVAQNGGFFGMETGECPGQRGERRAAGGAPGAAERAARGSATGLWSPGEEAGCPVNCLGRGPESREVAVPLCSSPNSR